MPLRYLTRPGAQREHSARAAYRLIALALPAIAGVSASVTLIAVGGAG